MMRLLAATGRTFIQILNWNRERREKKNYLTRCQHQMNTHWPPTPQQQQQKQPIWFISIWASKIFLGNNKLRQAQTRSRKEREKNERPYE